VSSSHDIDINPESPPKKAEKTNGDKASAIKSRKSTNATQKKRPTTKAHQKNRETTAEETT
jgi:hypothetical protein